MNSLINLIKKHSDIVAYAFFGVCTTVVNIASYYVCAHWFGLSTVTSTIIAWIVGVVFAYITNKMFVFKSRSWAGNVLLREVLSFFFCRAATGVMDVGIMFVGVDVWKMYDIGVKTFSNIMVIVLNYVASKLIIFKSV